MTALITSVGEVLTGVIGWIGDVFTMIFSNDLFLFLILVPICVGVVFFVVRLIMSIRKRSI